jgi:hypothetical protein
MPKAPANNTPFKDKERAEAWRKERKMILSGQAMFKRDGKAQLVIYPHEVANILKTSLRTAQRRIKEIRRENGKPDRVPITIQDFCRHFHFEEDLVQKQLADLY